MATLIFISGRGSAISPAKEGQSGFIYSFGKELISFLGRANVHFMEILTVYTLNSHLLTLKAHNHKIHVFCSPLKYLKPHRQTVWIQISLLLWEQSDLGPHCLPLYLCKIDIFRIIYFAGVLRSK